MGNREDFEELMEQHDRSRIVDPYKNRVKKNFLGQQVLPTDVVGETGYHPVSVGVNGKITSVSLEGKYYSVFIESDILLHAYIAVDSTPSAPVVGWYISGRGYATELHRYMNNSIRLQIAFSSWTQSDKP